MAQYTYTGYDASAHVAEETKNASVAAPRGIVTSVLVSVIGGFILLYSITAAITDRSEEGLAALSESATGLPPAQIFLDSLDSPTVAKFLLFIVCVAQFFCGMASVTANSRMSYAFSRDNALPGSRIWAKVNPRTGTPTNSIWLCVVLSVILASPALVSTDGLLRRHLDRGDRALHRLRHPGAPAPAQPRLHARARGTSAGGAPLIGWVAVVWVVIICILFVLPPVAPVDVSTFNYAPVAVLVVLAFATVSWLVGGRQTLHAGGQGRGDQPGGREGAGQLSERARRPSRGSRGRRPAARSRGRHAFEDCVERLATAIRLGVYPYGSALPPERELAVALGVSRATLREAIAALRAAGMVATTRGRGGGTRGRLHEPPTPGQRRPGPAAAAGASELLDALVFRRVVEPGAVLGRRGPAARAPAERALVTDALAAVAAARPTRPSTGRPTPGCTWRSPRVTGSARLVEAVTAVQAGLHDMLVAIPVLPGQHRALQRPARRDRRRRAGAGRPTARAGRWSSTATTPPRCCAACWTERRRRARGDEGPT